MFYYHFSQKSPKKLNKRRLHTQIMVQGWQRTGPFKRYYGQHRCASGTDVLRDQKNFVIKVTLNALFDNSLTSNNFFFDSRVKKIPKKNFEKILGPNFFLNFENLKIFKKILKNSYGLKIAKNSGMEIFWLLALILKLKINFK